MGPVIGLPWRGFCHALRERTSGREKLGREYSRRREIQLYEGEDGHQKKYLRIRN